MLGSSKYLGDDLKEVINGLHDEIIDKIVDNPMSDTHIYLSSKVLQSGENPQPMMWHPVNNDGSQNNRTRIRTYIREETLFKLEQTNKNDDPRFSRIYTVEFNEKSKLEVTMIF